MHPLRRELELRRRLFENSPAWEPQPTNQPQRAAFESVAQEIGYGGAKGGGKSQLGTGLSAMRHHYTHCYRKTYEEHSAMLEFMKTEFPPRLVGQPPVYRPTKRIRKIKSRSIRFCHLEHDNDIKKYQGKAVDLVWIDEAVHFTRRQVDLLSAENRLLKPHEANSDGVFCQVLLTFNPPMDETGLWVLDFFAPWINPDHPQFGAAYGKILYCAYIDGIDYFFEENNPITHHPVTGAEFTRPIQLKSRTFFRATLFDNEAYRNDDAYLARLQSLPELERRALLDGEMTASLVDALAQIFKRNEWIAAIDRWHNTPKPDEDPLVISIDCTGGGDDLFVAVPVWKGGWVGMPVSEKGNIIGDALNQVEWVARYMRDDLHCDPEKIPITYDASGGYGEGFAIAWKQKFPNALLVPFKGASVSDANTVYEHEWEKRELGAKSGMRFLSGTIGYANKISSAWIRAGEMLGHPSFNICIPPHKEMQRQALARRIQDKSSVKVSIEPKAIDPNDPHGFMKRLGCSPDFADALVMGLHYVSVTVAVEERKW